MDKNSNNFFSIATLINIVFLLIFPTNDSMFVLNRLVFIALSIVFIFKVFKNKIRLNKIILIFIPFFLMMFASIIWTVNYDQSVYRIFSILYYFLNGLLIYLISYNNLIKENIVEKSILISIVVVTFSAIYEYQVVGVARASGLIQNANEYAILILYLSFIYLMIRKNKMRDYFFIIIPVLISVIISGSRKSLIGFLYVIFMIILSKMIERYRQNKISKNRLIKILFLYFSILLITILIINNKINLENFNIESLNRLIERTDNSYNVRNLMKVTGIQLFEYKPILGYGVDSFRIISGLNAYSHDNYIELLVSMGIIGLISYYYIYLAILKHSYKRHKTNKRWKFQYTFIFISLTAILESAYVIYHSTSGWTILFLIILFNQEKI